MENNDLILYAGLAIAGYIVYKRVFNAPLTQEQGAAALENAGLKVSFANGNKVYATSGDTTFRFNEGEFTELNFAQRVLIGADRYVPGSWLTKAVLT